MTFRTKVLLAQAPLGLALAAGRRARRPHDLVAGRRRRGDPQGELPQRAGRAAHGQRPRGARPRGADAPDRPRRARRGADRPAHRALRRRARRRGRQHHRSRASSEAAAELRQRWERLPRRFTELRGLDPAAAAELVLPRRWRRHSSPCAERSTASSTSTRTPCCTRATAPASRRQRMGTVDGHRARSRRCCSASCSPRCSPAGCCNRSARLREAADRIGAGDFSARVPVGGARRVRAARHDVQRHGRSPRPLPQQLARRAAARPAGGAVGHRQPARPGGGVRRQRRRADRQPRRRDPARHRTGHRHRARRSSTSSRRCARSSNRRAATC